MVKRCLSGISPLLAIGRGILRSTWFLYKYYKDTPSPHSPPSRVLCSVPGIIATVQVKQQINEGNYCGSVSALKAGCCEGSWIHGVCHRWLCCVALSPLISPCSLLGWLWWADALVWESINCSWSLCLPQALPPARWPCKKVHEGEKKCKLIERSGSLNMFNIWPNLTKLQGP